MANLTEIIEEGESRLRNTQLAGELQTRDRRIRQAEAESFAVEHFPTLLAVAKAAVEAERKSTVARAVYGAIPDESRQGEWQREAWCVAGEADDAIEELFATVRGEEGKKG